MVLDYSKVCGACSTPLDSPPRDGADAMCAYLHTRAGRREFARWLKRNRQRQAVVDRADEATVSDEATVNEATQTPEATPEPSNEATSDDEATVFESEATSETKSQRYKRLNRDKINEAQKRMRRSDQP